MTISQLEINNFRNIANIKLSLSSNFNLFYGENGAGKTSILEAIYYLGMGRSFRTNYNRRIISNWSERALIFAQKRKDATISIPIGIEFSKQGKKQIRIAKKDVKTRAQLVKLLPLQLINTNSYRLLESGPKCRRPFLDWGTFHVKPTFLCYWQSAQRTLQQRNAALRDKTRTAQQVNIWDQELTSASMVVHQLRQEYVASFTPYFENLIETLLPDIKVELKYYPGWDTTHKLEELLYKNFYRDAQLGYTSIGPQRADLSCTVDNVSAHDLLSRGQQKLLVCALQLAQGIHLQNTQGINCLYLIDDLPSELDADKRQKVIGVLKQMGSQVLISHIEKDTLPSDLVEQKETSLFHVKQGAINVS